MLIIINSQLKNKRSRKEDELEDILQWRDYLASEVVWRSLSDGMSFFFVYIWHFSPSSLLDPVASPLLSLNSPSCVEWILCWVCPCVLSVGGRSPSKIPLWDCWPLGTRYALCLWGSIKRMTKCWLGREGEIIKEGEIDRRGREVALSIRLECFQSFLSQPRTWDVLPWCTCLVYSLGVWDVLRLNPLVKQQHHGSMDAGIDVASTGVVEHQSNPLIARLLQFTQG